MTETQAPPVSPTTPGNATKRGAWVLLMIPVLFIALRSVFAWMNELSGDEAYYWIWSRNVAWGYLDHPPMIAWLIAASIRLLGASELTVRLPAILLGGGTILLATCAGHLLGLERKRLLHLQVLLLCFPMLHVMGTISTPDTPAMFFVLLTLTAGLLCLRSPQSWWHWLLLGISAGLSMQSKYTALLPVACILLFLLIHCPRRWYRPVLAGLIAVVILLPLFHWNYERRWISFLYQLHHGTSPDGRSWFMNLGDYLGAQLLVATPLLAPLLVWAGLKFSRTAPTSGHRLFAITSMGTLAFFALTSLRHKGEANWPTQAWVPLVVLLVTFLPAEASHLSRYTRTAAILSGIFVFTLMLPPSLLSRINKHSPLHKIGGWSQLAREIRSSSGTKPIICMRYQDASLFSFYLPRQPSVRALRRQEDRPTQFDLLTQPNMTKGFVLVSDAPLTPGDRLRLFQGPRAHEVEVLSIDHHAVKVDDLASRGRFIAICRLVPRDVATKPGYIKPTP